MSSLEQNEASSVEYSSLKKAFIVPPQADWSRLHYSDQHGVSNRSRTQPLHKGTNIIPLGPMTLKED